ncbi:MAG: hypothetical protein Q4G58_16045, partial [bacterium]|nr:hypothetical protein [bacterium]
YIDRCIFKYTKEFGDIKEFADFLYEYKLIDDPEKYRFDTEEEEETTEFVADEADFFDVFDIETDDEFDDFDIDANIEFDDFSLETEEEPVVTKSMKRYIEADEIPQYEHYDSINDDEVFIDKIKRRIV